MNTLTRATVLSVVLLASGCGVLASAKHLLSGPKSLREVTLVAAPNMNGNGAVSVDVVVFSSQGAMDTVSRLSAAEWFTGRADLTRKFRNDLWVKSWEIAPSQTIDGDVKPDEIGFPLGATVFASYAGKAEFQAQVVNVKKIVVRLGESDFEVDRF